MIPPFCLSLFGDNRGLRFSVRSTSVGALFCFTRCFYDRKKLILLFLSLTIILSACKYSNKTISEPPTEEPTYEVFKINISAECVSNDSVGNEWVHSYYLDGQRIYSGHQITLPLNELPVFKTITATIEEIDKYPDTSSKDISFEIKGGEERHETIVVTEGDGCRKGREAVWNVMVSVEKIVE